jgi:hypothetical protein
MYSMHVHLHRAQGCTQSIVLVIVPGQPHLNLSRNSMKLATHPASDHPMFAGVEINKSAFKQGIDKAKYYRFCHTGHTRPMHSSA